MDKPGTQDFDLEGFLPYLLNQAAEATSKSFHDTYKAAYGMTRTQWRVLANLGKFGSMTARDICTISHIEKTKVSRAVAALEAEGWAPSVRQIVDSTIMGWCGHWVPAMGLRLRGSPSASRLVLERLERARRADELVLSPREALLAHYADCTSPQVSASQTAKGPQR